MLDPNSSVGNQRAAPPQPQPVSSQDVTSCQGLRPAPVLTVLLALLVVCTGGLFGLLVLWLPRLRHALLYRPCALEGAPFVRFQVGGRCTGPAAPVAAQRPGCNAGRH